jgi:hypothetical protein
MQYVSFEPGIEVRGGGVNATLEAFNAFSLLASQIMVAEGCGELGEDGLIRANSEGWYSLDANLQAFRRISREIGDHVLYRLGAVMPKHAKLPPDVQSVPDVFATMDIAFHMNHRKNGVEMFDPANGRMLEGIGHYSYDPDPVHKRIISVARNPYPCPFDRGLFEAMAARFDPKARVIHDDTKPCRNKGADACTLIVEYT